MNKRMLAQMQNQMVTSAYITSKQILRLALHDSVGHVNVTDLATVNWPGYRLLYVVHEMKEKNERTFQRVREGNDEPMNEETNEPKNEKKNE